MEIAVVGSGAIGGVIGAHLARAGEDVVFCDIVTEHVARINQDGIRIEGPDETFIARAAAFTPEELVRRGKTLQTVLLCVKGQHTEAAVRELLPILGPSTQVVSMQNGFCENVISAIIGTERTIGCFVNFSADYLEPGRILYGGVSALYLGELDGTLSPRILDLQRRLSCWGPIHVSDNIWGYLWGKMSYGALLFGTALVDETMAGVVLRIEYRDALMELCSEVLEAAERAGVTPLGFDNWKPEMVYPRESRDVEKLNAQLEVLANWMAGNKKTKSGIWRDLAVRKRKTEVDFQLGLVQQIAAEHGLDVPVTSAVIRMIKEIEAGTRPMSWENLTELNHIYEVSLQAK